METSLNQHVCHFMRVQCLFGYESFKSPYLSVCVCLLSLLSLACPVAMSLCPSCCVSSLSASLATSHHRSGRDTHTWTRTLISNRRTHTNHRSNEMTISFERRREKKKLFMIFWTEILPAGIKWWKTGRERSQTVYYCKARLTFRLESLNYRRKVIQLTTTELKHWLWEHVRQHLANASEPS